VIRLPRSLPWVAYIVDLGLDKEFFQKEGFSFSAPTSESLSGLRAFST
jgi:hypothetical protein